MSRTISWAKNHLLQCIQDVSKNAWSFSTAPEKNFTRNRKLSFETIVKTLLCMEGGTERSISMKHNKQNITAMVTGMVIGAALVNEAAAGIVAEPTWQKIYVDG